jgi:hypothetical protein
MLESNEISSSYNNSRDKPEQYNVGMRLATGSASLIPTVSKSSPLS